MSDYNLIDEPWISVVVDYKGTTKLVGLKEFFEHAHEYIALAGDMPTQDFAVMRFLLAILHTVFSRYDAHGEAYEMIELNDRMQQIEKVDLEDEEDYEDALMETWKDLWNAKKFPEIVVKYLDAWHDRFYLFDDKYPFYQVTKEEI
ncbi:MAG: type I-E CRISPR-associated protein Cse1/CasA, partial [Lactobacillus iners]|nr:type I-E CRISPR-associated protein Cse1/CasA [Lactobacillus iners]